MKPFSAIGCGLLAAFLLAHCANADTYIAQCNADTWMLGENGYSGNNNGASDSFATGINDHGSPMRALLKFNLSGIPANATISSVRLYLTQVRNQNGAGASFALYRMLKSWTEGAGGQFNRTGDPAQPGETTWNKRLESSTVWGQPGAMAQVDYSTTLSSTIFVLFESVLFFESNTDLVADVQGWIGNPASNFGWLMKDENEDPLSTTARRWGSRESGNPPSLVVTYTIPSPTAQSPSISSVVRNNNQIRFTFNAEANRTYAVESRNNVGSGTWSNAATYSASSVATNFSFSETIFATNKFYRLRTP